MNAMARRVALLERTIPPVIPAEVRALAERMAADDGGLYTAAELITGMQETLQAIGYPYTQERIVAYICRREGITPDELLDEIDQSQERYPL